MRKTIKRILAGAMALGLAATMMPGLSMTAKAADGEITLTAVSNATWAPASGGTFSAVGDFPKEYTLTPATGYEYRVGESYTPPSVSPTGTNAGNATFNTNGSAVEGSNFKVVINAADGPITNPVDVALEVTGPAPSEKKYAVNYVVTGDTTDWATAFSTADPSLTAENSTAEFHKNNYTLTNVTPNAGYRIKQDGIKYSVARTDGQAVNDQPIGNGGQIPKEEIHGEITITYEVEQLHQVQITGFDDDGGKVGTPTADTTNNNTSGSGDGQVDGNFHDVGGAKPYSVLKGDPFTILVEDSAEYMFTSASKVVTDNAGSLSITITERAATAKGIAKIDSVTADTKILKIEPMAPVVKVKAVAAEGSDDAKGDIIVTSTKSPASMANRYSDEQDNTVDLTSAEDGHNPGTEAYTFAVKLKDGSQFAEEDILIRDIEINGANTDPAYTGSGVLANGDTDKLGNGALGEYTIPVSVMSDVDAGDTLTIKVTVALKKTVYFEGYDPGTYEDIEFSVDGKQNEPGEYGLDYGRLWIADDMDPIVINADTPQGKKFDSNPELTSDAQDGVEFGVLNSPRTTLPITITPKDLKYKRTGTTGDIIGTLVTVMPKEALLDYAEDPRAPRQRSSQGRKGIPTAVADANNGKNTTGTESSDTTTGQTGSETPAVSTGFADDDQIADYAKPYVKAAADAGIIKGVGNNRFDPKGSATRSAFATMIQRAKGLTADKTSSKFPDVLASDLGEDLTNGVIACEDLDPFIVEGYPDGTFQPRKPVTRAEGILMIWRAAGKPAYTGAAKFNDLADWYAEAANWGAEQGIVNGVGGGRFDGGATLTRQDLATMLGRAIEKGIIKPAAAVDDKADESKTDETKTDEKTDDSKTEDGKTDESKTDEAADGEKKEA